MTKTDFDAELSSFNRKINSNKTKHLLVENQLKKLETFDSIYFCGKSHFEDDGTQNYLVFQSIYKYFEITPTTNTILSWKSKGLSDETIKPPRPHTGHAPELSYVVNKTRVKFNGSCLTQNQIIFYHKNIVNIYIVYELILHNSDSSYPTSVNCLFGAVKLTRDTDIDNYKYFGYRIGFDRKGFFQFVMKSVEM